MTMSIPRGPLHQAVTIAREFTDSRHPTVSRSVEPSALPLKWSRMRWRSVLMLGFTVWPFCLLGDARHKTICDQAPDGTPALERPVAQRRIPCVDPGDAGIGQGLERKSIAL